MSSCHKAGLVMAIMLAILDYVTWDHDEPFRSGSSQAEVMKCVVFLELSYFYLLCILPLCVAILPVDEHIFLVISWHLVTRLVDWLPAEVA
jgi:hypothetical protein